MTATIRRLGAQKELAPRPKAAEDSQADGASACNGDFSETAVEDNDLGEWESSELDEQRWGLSPLLDLGAISSEARPEPAGGALMALAHDLKAEALGRPARALPRFATFAPWDADADQDVRDEQRPNCAAEQVQANSPEPIADPAARKKQKLRAYRDRQQMAKHRFRRIEKMMRENRTCADCRKRMDMHGIFANRPLLARREHTDVLVCRECEERIEATERNGAT